MHAALCRYELALSDEITDCYWSTWIQGKMSSVIATHGTTNHMYHFQTELTYILLIHRQIIIQRNSIIS